MERRNFIKGCGLFCMGSLALSTLLSSCSSIHYAMHEIKSNQIHLKKTEFLDEKNGMRKFVVIRTDKLEFPICVYQLGSSEFVALYMQCTHRGCELQPNKTSLVCPCHGSEFSNKGQVLSPPADENLKQFTIRSDNETIYIQL